MNSSDFQSLLERIAKLKLFVIGDVMLDHYIWGDTQRLSPEAPVPVVEVNRDEYRPGGAANVAMNIRSLRADVGLMGWIGEDAAGKELRSIFQREHIHFDLDFISKNAPSIVKTRVIVRGQQICRIDREARPSAYHLDFEQHLPKLREEISACDGVVLSDYAKGVLTPDNAQKLVDEAHKLGKMVAYDPKPRSLMRLKGMDVMTPNKAESLQLAGITLAAGDPFPAEQICKAIWDAYAPKHLIITLGGDGMLLSHEGNAIEHIPTYAREVYDVSGAGDTVISVLALALAAGATLQEAARLANTAAGVVVAKMGTASASPEEILAYSKGH